MLLLFSFYDVSICAASPPKTARRELARRINGLAPKKPKTSENLNFMTFRCRGENRLAKLNNRTAALGAAACQVSTFSNTSTSSFTVLA